MATEDGEDVQRAEKVVLKRKLTGPPRLLLGKTRTRSVGEDRSEAQTNKNKMESTGGDKSSPKYSAAAESDTAKLTETANVEEVSSEVNVESSRGRREAAGEDDDIRNRKVNRRRWWRRFLPAVVCNRKQKKDIEESLEKQQSDGSVPPEGVLLETDAAGLNNTEENTEKVTKGKRRLNARTWSTFKRFLTSSDGQQTHKQRRDFVEKDDDEPSMTFRKKLRKFFTKGGKKRSCGVPLENMEDTTKCEESLCSSVAQVDEPTELHSDVTVGSLEVVMVTAEVSVQLTEEAAAESPDETQTEEQLVCDTDVTEEDLTDAVDGSETLQTDHEVIEGPTDTNNVPVEDLIEVVSSEKDEVFCNSTEVVLDAGDQLSASTTSSQDASELHCEEKTDERTSQSFQPSTNGPFIRIELVPPDDVTQEDEEEEERWEGSSSSDNHNHLLLLSFDHSERQLVQTARSLVRAAMNAAVDQLTRELQSESDCVHREPQGCRDHA